MKAVFTLGLDYDRIIIELVIVIGPSGVQFRE